MRVILYLREKRRPSGRRGIAASARQPMAHFSMFAAVFCGWLLVNCMDVQLSTYRRPGPAPAGEGQARPVALCPGARGQHRLQLLQRVVGESVRAGTAVLVGI